MELRLEVSCLTKADVVKLALKPVRTSTYSIEVVIMEKECSFHFLRGKSKDPNIVSLA